MMLRARKSPAKAQRWGIIRSVDSLLEREMPRRPNAPPVTFTCEHCQKPFTMGAGYVTQYRLKWNRDPKYCSSACFGGAKAKEAEERIEGVCEHCGKEYRRARKPSGFLVGSREGRRFCSTQCHYAWQRDQDQLPHLPGFKSRHLRTDGYVDVRAVGARGNRGEWYFEHRAVMEREIGRELFDHETVHHRNGNRADNRVENLELWSSRHGAGQRVEEKISFSKSLLAEYGFRVAENCSFDRISEVTDIYFQV